MRPGRGSTSGHHVVAHGGGAGEIVGADRQHERVVARRGQPAAASRPRCRRRRPRRSRPSTPARARRRAGRSGSGGGVPKERLRTRTCSPLSLRWAMTQPTEATIAARLVEPSAPAALMLTRRAPGATPRKPDLGSSPAMIPATWRPVPVGVEVGQIAVAALVGEVGTLHDLALGGQRGHRDHPGVDHGDVDAAARRARLVGADRFANLGEGRAGRGGGSAAALPASAQPFIGPSATTATTPAAAPRARSEPAGTSCHEAVDDRQ